MLDIPCGDFRWMSTVNIEGISYHGADIVDRMIEDNIRDYGGDSSIFSCLDITKDALPKVDLVLVRDCLVHLSFSEINDALANLVRSQSRYLCMTHFCKSRANVDISAGKWRPLNFLERPFEFPEPIHIISEGCTENAGLYSDKSLAVWRISDIASQCLRLSEKCHISAQKNVFAYWTGDKPALIEILHELMRLHSNGGSHYNLNILSRDDFLRDYSDIPACFEALCPAHQADVVRVWALHEHGGIWLDSDTIVMNSLASLFYLLESRAGFFVTENNNCICNGVFGSRGRTDLLCRWKSYISNHLSDHGPNIQWTEIGGKYLTHACRKHKELFDEYIIYDGSQTVYPVAWNQCVNAFLEKPYWTHRHLVRDNQPLIVLVNSVYKALGGLTKRQIIESEYPLNYFLNASLRELVF